jgi:hypothetical protein
MGDFLTIKDKIVTFLRLQNIKKNDFFEATGIQASNFKGKNMQSQPGGDMLVKILSVYPEISAEWLMRGEGEMLKENGCSQKTNIMPVPHIPQTEVSERKTNSDTEVLNKLFDSLSEKERELRKQAEEIGGLRERIKQLEYELKKHASAVSTSEIASVG